MQDDDSLLPIIPVQGHLYSDFLGGPDVEVSAVFLLTRRNVSKTQALYNTEESTVPATGLWLTDSDPLDATLPKVLNGPVPSNHKYFNDSSFELYAQVKNLLRTFRLQMKLWLSQENRKG